PHSWLRHGSLEWPWRIACFPWWKVSCSRQRRMHYRPSNEPPPSKPGPPTIALPLRFPTTPSAAKPCTKAATIDAHSGRYEHSPALRTAEPPSLPSSGPRRLLPRRRGTAGAAEDQRRKRRSGRSTPPARHVSPRRGEFSARGVRVGC